MTRPTVTRVVMARAAMQALGRSPRPDLCTASGVDSIDIIAVLLETLDQKPDAALMVQARDHFLAMVANNRVSGQGGAGNRQ